MFEPRKTCSTIAYEHLGVRLLCLMNETFYYARCPAWWGLRVTKNRYKIMVNYTDITNLKLVPSFIQLIQMFPNVYQPLPSQIQNDFCLVETSDWGTSSCSQMFSSLTVRAAIGWTFFVVKDHLKIVSIFQLQFFVKVEVHEGVAWQCTWVTWRDKCAIARARPAGQAQARRGVMRRYAATIT